MSNIFDWTRATLREEVSGAAKGEDIVFRRSNLKLKVGPTWWIVVLKTRQVIHLAESYGGHDLYQVAKRCNPLSSPGPKTYAMLEALIYPFESKSVGSLPIKEATRKSNLKSRVSISRK